MKYNPIPIRATVALVSLGLSLAAWSQTTPEITPGFDFLVNAADADDTSEF